MEVLMKTKTEHGCKERQQIESLLLVKMAALFLKFVFRRFNFIIGGYVEGHRGRIALRDTTRLRKPSGVGSWAWVAT